jgi:hypothetical protein
MDAVNIFIGTIREEKARGIEAHNIFPKAEEMSGSVINQLIFGYIYIGVGILVLYPRNFHFSIAGRATGRVPPAEGHA